MISKEARASIATPKSLTMSCSLPIQHRDRQASWVGVFTPTENDANVDTDTDNRKIVCCNIKEKKVNFQFVIFLNIITQTSQQNLSKTDYTAFYIPTNIPYYFNYKAPMKHSIQNGFSLIELMIVVAIIGILSMIAIPSYENYTIRARFSEVVSATDPFKTSIALALQEGTPLNELANGSNGIPIEPLPTKNLDSLSVKNGIITAKSTNIAGDATLILTPNTDGSAWSIEGSCVNLGLCNN